MENRGSAPATMTHHVPAIPEGYHTATPVVIVHDGAAALDFYRRAFGAKELNRSTDPGGKIMHAALQIGDSKVFVADEFPEMGSKSAKSLGGSPGGIWLYVPDCDATIAQAVKAGVNAVMPVAGMFGGDRFGQVIDPFGHRWSVATQKEIVTGAELETRAKKFMTEMAQMGSQRK